MLEEINEILYFEGEEGVQWFLDFSEEWQQICANDFEM